MSDGKFAGPLASVLSVLGSVKSWWRPPDDRPEDADTLPREAATRRQDDEARRRRDDAAMADFVDSLPVGVFSANPAGRLLYVNRTLAYWLSAEPQALVGRPFADFVAGADGAGQARLIGTDGREMPCLFAETEKTAADGHLLYTRSIVMPMPQGTAVAAPAAAQVRDDPSHAPPPWLFDAAPVGIALLDLDGLVTDANRAFQKLIGLAADAINGRPFADFLAAEDRGEVDGQLSKVVMGAAQVAHLEVRMTGAGERRITANLFASAVKDPAGDLAGLIVHAIDATEQKDLEVQFAQSQKMQAVGQLAGGVAHDFNNLLTAMIGFADLLLVRHGPEDPSFADIMQIKQNANRATNLVRQLLAFSRKQTLKPVVLDPTDALSDLSNLLGRLIGATIELRMEHGRDLGLILVDRGQFDQVVVNLAVNARDAMPGGGTLTIRTFRVGIEAPSQRGHELVPAGDYVQIDVVDTGVGIPKENIARIFEPFFSTKEVGAGTGLGLSTVYGIVHQTGGFIFVESAPGAGTTFSILLPLHAATEAQKAAAVRTPEREGDLTGAGTVLLVEDEDAVRMFGARALSNKGYRVLEANNGEKALDVVNEALAAGETIDLIISDVVMPGMDGHTLVRLLQQELPNVKVILMSGYAEDVFIDDLPADGSVNFLEKPFSLAGLAGKVKEVMRG